MEENVSVQIFGRAIPFTKEMQKSTAAALVEKVKNGEADPITAFATIKAMYECLGQLLKDKEAVEATINQVKKYGRTGASFNGANLCITEIGIRYDYSVCQDPEWDELSRQKSELETKLKERETFLRGVTKPQTIVIEETGEVKTIYGPAKTSATSIKVTFAK